MTIHDEYARLTPMELAFPDRDTAAGWFREIADEAEARGADDADPSAFVMLMAVGRAVREIGAAGAEASVQQHGALLFHLFRCWREGDPLYLVDLATARLLVEVGSWSATRPVLPSASAYVQWPQHLFWVGSDDGSPAESVDGLFWTASGDRVSFLLVMGIRPDRPGFSVVPLGPVSLDEVPHWAERSVRDGGNDFSSRMPGAELDGLYELRTAGEALKLGARTLLHLGSAGEAPVRREASPPEGDEAMRPTPSSLAYTRLTLPRAEEP